jgi:purine-binding chemotaxis protein CheW
MSSPLVLSQPQESNLQLLEFISEGKSYACDLLWVKEVLRAPAVTPVHLAPSYVRGVVHLRGQILTAIDLEFRLGLKGCDTRPINRCIVFKTASDLSRLPVPPDDAYLVDSDRTGLLVDSIGDILPSGFRILASPPEMLSGLDTRFILGVISGPQGLTTVLNVGEFISQLEPMKSQS